MAAFANNANDIAKTYAGIGDKMKAFPGAKSIMGKGTPYKDSWITDRRDELRVDPAAGHMWATKQNAKPLVGVYSAPSRMNPGCGGRI